MPDSGGNANQQLFRILCSPESKPELLAACRLRSRDPDLISEILSLPGSGPVIGKTAQAGHPPGDGLKDTLESAPKKRAAHDRAGRVFGPTREISCHVLPGRMPPEGVHPFSPLAAEIDAPEKNALTAEKEIIEAMLGEPVSLGLELSVELAGKIARSRVPEDFTKECLPGNTASRNRFEYSPGRRALPESIEAIASVLVHEAAMRFGDFLEALLRKTVPGIPVRMEFVGKPAIRLFDLFVAGRFVDSENVVESFVISSAIP